MAERHDLSPRGAPRSYGPGDGQDFTDVFGPDGTLRSPFRSVGEAETEQAEASEANSEQQASRRRRLEESRVPPVAPPVDNSQAMLQQLMYLVQTQNQRMNQLEAELAQARSQRNVPPSPPGLRGNFQFGGQGGLGGPGVQGGGGGRSNELPEGKVPFGINLPAVDWKSWKGRTQELVGFRNWFETFLSWLNLINEVYPLECREVVSLQREMTRGMMNQEQWARSQRLLTFVRQSFEGWYRIEGLVQHYVSLAPAGESNGFEALRLVHKELSLQNRAEALALRTTTLNLSAKSERLAEVVRSVEGQLHQFDQLLDSSAIVRGDLSLRVSEADKVIVLLKQLPQAVRMFVQLHGRSQTFDELKNCVLDYDTNTRLLSDVASLRVTRDDPHKGSRHRSTSRDSKGSKGSKGKGKGANSGLCWNCGKAGHRQKDCPDPPKDKGKGKGKKKDGGKGSGQRSKSSDKETKEKICFKCKKKGHFAANCPLNKDRNRALSDTEPEQEASSAGGDAQLVMAMKACALPSGTSSGTRSTEEVATARVADLVSRLPSSNVAARVQWLVDSGATSHIVGSRFLSHYKVRQKHTGVKVELFAANGQTIANDGLVDLELILPIRYPGKSKTVQGSVILQKCIVADLEFNVLSPFVLLSQGWKTVLDNEAESALVLKANQTSIPLTTFDRAWWLHAGGGQRGRKNSPGRGRGKYAMEVDKVIIEQKDDLKVVDGPIDVEKSVDSSKGILESHSQFSDRVTELGRLTFLLRGLRSVVATEEPVDQGELVRSSDLEMSEAENEPEDEDSDLGELPPPEGEEAEEDGDPEELAGPDLELGPGSTYDHLCKGHYPYLKSCRSCARANGKIPARRLAQPVGKTEIGADFGFLGRVRFLVIVVMFTQMVSVIPMTDDRERDLRSCNMSLKELGLTGKHIHLRLDGESMLGQFMRSAAKGETFPGTGISFWTTPPGRSQANGLEAVKCGVGSNLLFLEERLQRRIPFESGLVRFLMRYVGRMRNLYHVRSGSDCSAIDRLRGRKGSKTPRTFPFGCRLLGKIAGSGENDHSLERLSECVYLGPIHSGGGGFLGKLAGGSLVGKEPEEAEKILKFSGGRIVVPVKWYAEDLGELLEGSLPANVPMSGPQDPENPKTSN